MTPDELQDVISILERRNGRPTQGPRERVGIGSGVQRPSGLDSNDPAIQQDARASYVREMTDRAPLSQLNTAERTEYLKAIKDVMKADGFYTG